MSAGTDAADARGQPMDRPLHILHLEDSRNDAELVEAALAGDGIACRIRCVDTRNDFQAAIERDVFDLILADYSLPSFDGRAAQDLARILCPDVPFIFVSGTLGEEVATERLKSGATDYVLKHHLARLPRAVRRALQEARERNAREHAQAEIRALNSDLERRVAERTRQLAGANDALRAGEERMARILETVAEGIVIFDMAGRLTFVNRGGERILGMSRDALLQHRFTDDWWGAGAAPGGAASDGAFPIEQTFASGEALDDIEVVAHRPDGTRVTLSVNAAALRDDRGTMAGVVVSFRDVTERRRAAEAVRQAKEEAESANRAKSDFLSRMSHDLRTPLNAILGFAQLLEIESHQAHQENVAQILRAGRHLLDLINEVLDIARIEAGQLSLSPEPVDLDEVIPQTLELISPLASSRGISLHNRAAAGRHYVLADRQRLTQILLNLLSNAVKYNRHAGSVTVSIEPVERERIRITVADTGRGLSPDQIEMLFQPFERLGAEQTEIEGTGLGLALSKGLAEAMGGSVGLASEVDRGSTFWVELMGVEAPVRQESGATRAAGGPGGPSTTTGVVLYVEDNTSNVRLFERIVAHRPGVRLLAAAQGQRGLELAVGHRPDLIFLDLHLPDMHGEELLHRLWADVRTRGIPVVILTADATPAQGRRLLAAGATAYLTKPFEIARVLGLLDDVLADKRIP